MFILFRLISIVLTICLVKVLTTQTFFHLVTAIGIAHYVLSFTASSTKIKDIYFTGIKRNPVRAIVPWMFLIASVFLALKHYPGGIIIAFAIHNALSDGYLFKDQHFFKASAPSRVALNIFLYSYLIYPHLWRTDVFILMLVASCSHLLWTVRSQKASAKNVIEIVAFEAAMAIPVFLFKGHPQAFICIVLYHFIFWFLLSLHWEKGSKMLSLCKHLGIIILLFISIESMIGHAYFAPDIWLVVFGYIHIFVSFFISKLNPSFFLRFQEKN